MAHFFHISRKIYVLIEAKEAFRGGMALNSQESVFGLNDRLTAFQSEVEDDRSEREFKTLPLLRFS